MTYQNSSTFFYLCCLCCDLCVRMGSTGVTLADLPNIFIMIAALAALFIMLVILLRNMEFIGIVGEGARADTWHRAGFRPPRVLMQRVKIPFTFKLIDDKLITYSEVHCTVSSRVRYWMTSWWGAPINELHSTLWGTLSDILVSRQFVQSDKHEEKPLTLSCACAPRLGAPPRSCYPLVVILARDSRDTGQLYPDDTVALVTIIHIKDDQCSNPSGILAQYLKQANGNLSSLKPLYLNSMGHVGAEMGNGQAGAADVCCVCASGPSTRALLPCRHACLCSDCLPKLDKCPMCRSIIDSYFCIRSDDEQLDMKQQAFSLNRRIFNLFHYH